MPSAAKKAISTNVSDSVPLIGQRIRTIPAAMAMTAEISAHQKPGALRIQNVVTRPTPPLIKNSQPMMSVKASVASERHDDRRGAEHEQNDAFDQKQPPMGMDCIGERHVAGRRCRRVDSWSSFTPLKLGPPLGSS